MVFLCPSRPTIWALLNHLDKYLLGHFFKEDAAGPVLVVFTGFAGIIVAIAILLLGFPVFRLAPRQASSVMVAGALPVASYIPYMIAMQRQEASIVASLYRLIPVFVFVLSYIVLGETLQPKQIVGGCVTITGAILLVVDLDKRGRGFDLVTFFLMSAACLMNACTVVIFAGLMAPLALVSIVTGLHPFFLLFYGILFTLFFPTFGRERLARRQILQRVVAVGVMCAGMATTFIA